jgi:hypothetical protein
LLVQLADWVSARDSVCVNVTLPVELAELEHHAVEDMDAVIDARGTETVTEYVIVSEKEIDALAVVLEEGPDAVTEYSEVLEAVADTENERVMSAENVPKVAVDDPLSVAERGSRVSEREKVSD